ncbi:nucleotide-diphospho-sugar transferase [Pseudovirgaria hyperparasitica]|uniref:Nucleotide-diphospho-sugar transferase n=1 Tax=Pseudovirgaria hyperparasitica TaxID=470096 RepID=A0A6A6W765_9PEZI|nr:nucleotide-diphospho-sugar transferase [Pseudovirgaria hyperparasitica]KAF2757756.1 nucleotide-diphospho-sugar transferase [Pseudovirgaria hyperparasitica]
MPVRGRRYSDDPLPYFPPPAYTPRKRGRPSNNPIAIFRRNRTLILVGCFVLLVLWRLTRARNASPPPPKLTGAAAMAKADWSKYAYSLYATDTATLCHAVMVFEALQRLGSKAERVLFYPRHWDTLVSSATDRDSQLLVMARRDYKVVLMPTKIMNVFGYRTPDKPKKTWDESVSKLFAFTLTHFDRVIHLDSDLTLLQNIDELFFLPQATVAMPPAYWQAETPHPLTSLLMVVEPSMREFNALKAQIDAGAEQETVEARKYDMELLNERYGQTALTIPQRPYALLTGEFRNHNHTAYLGSEEMEWDAESIIKEAKLVHFSDWPMPKPWVLWSAEGLAEMQPDCGGSHEGSCAERRIWKQLYDGFREKRKDVCKLLSLPAPDWFELTGKIKEGEMHSDPGQQGKIKGEAESIGHIDTVTRGHTS